MHEVLVAKPGGVCTINSAVCSISGLSVLLTTTVDTGTHPPPLLAKKLLTQYEMLLTTKLK